jgi:hypothetical protein
MAASDIASHRSPGAAEMARGVRFSGGCSDGWRGRLKQYEHLTMFPSQA